MNVRIFAALAALAALAVLAAPTAAAHATKTTGDGKFKITWGWVEEPATTYSSNALDLRIVDAATGAGIGDLEKANLTVRLHHADDEMVFAALRTQFGKGAGNYTSSEPITPTAPGLYTLHVSGKIDGTDVDIEIAANHDLAGIEETYWPEKPGTDAELEARIAQLEAKVQALEAKAQSQSQTTTPVTSQTTPDAPVPALGLLGVLAAVGVVLALRRRS